MKTVHKYPTAKELLSQVRLSELTLLLYLCSQFVCITGSSLDVWICRLLFIIYVAIAFLFDILPSQLQTKRPFFTLISAWAVLFFSYALVSGLWSISIEFSLDLTYINNIIHIIVIITFMSYSISNTSDFERYLLLVLIMIMYIAVAILLKTPFDAWGTERIGSDINLNANTLGIFMAVGCLICLYFISSGRMKALGAVCIAFAAICLFSGSRKAALLLVILLTGYSVLRARGFKSFFLLMGAIVFVAILYGVVMTSPDLYNVLGFRIEQLVNSLLGEEISDGSITERAFFREQALEVFFKHPVNGIGMNGFMAYMAKIGYSHVAYSHCNYTELLCNFGIVGFVLYYGGLLAVFRDASLFSLKLSPAGILGVVLFVGLLITDYGMVSYAGIDNSIYLCLIWCALKTSQKEKLCV